MSVIQKDAPTVFSPQRAAASLSLDGQEGERGGQGVSLPSAAKGERFPRGAKGRIRAGNVFPCGRPESILRGFSPKGHIRHHERDTKPHRGEIWKNQPYFLAGGSLPFPSVIGKIAFQKFEMRK